MGWNKRGVLSDGGASASPFPFKESVVKNLLYYGDNLDVLKRHIKDEFVDLVYLDPPFNSNRNYNVLFKEQSGVRSSAQIKAFGDTWCWDESAAASYENLVRSGGAVADAMQAFYTFLGTSNMMAYLSMMAPRLVELRRVLKSTGSIYLHCDPTASHYLKMLMDAVFGVKNFRNEIVWRYRTGGNSKKHFAKKHDVLLFYVKSDTYTFNALVEKAYTKSKNRKPGLVNYGGGTAEFFEDEHGVYNIVTMSDVWDISYLNSQAKERLGYPTQKPEALLDRIIKASSNLGDVVMDPFCGCGTAIASAQKLERKWIGIDITYLATNLIKHRLQDTFGPEIKESYEVIGEPTDLEGARQLAKDDRYQFQWWSLGLVGARPAEGKKGADHGIDGKLYFFDETHQKKAKQILFSVKSGHVKVGDIRDLRGVIERERAAIGVFITLEPPTGPMKREAASAGFYESLGWGEKYPRIQILTVEDLLAGCDVKRPPTNTTFKKAPRADGDAEQGKLNFT